MKEIIIAKNDAGQRVDRFLMKAFPALPRSYLYKAVRSKKIKVNRKRCEIAQRLQEGDHVLLFIDPRFLQDEKKEHDFLQVPASLDVVYEDEHILVIDKPQGLRSQRDEQGPQDCAVSRILHYLYVRGEYDPDQEQSFVPALCNRLDRNTRGLLIAGKHARALRDMNAAIRAHEVHKYYLALCEGRVSPPEGTIMLRHRKEGMKAVLSEDEGKDCALSYRLLRADDACSLVMVELHSGRFHQIRASFAHIHHPLLGDVKYGARRQNGHQALCAFRLSFSLDPANSLSYLNTRVIELPKEKLPKQMRTLLQDRHG